jgi:hypothetical protein
MSMRPVLVAVAFAALSAACNAPQAKTANVVSAPMPSGEKFTGVYQHPVFGELHLVEAAGGSVAGKWQRADKSAWGELAGKTEGTVLRFTWAETKYGFVGPAATRKGKGVFVFERDDKFAYLKGQYGVGEDEAGSKWDNIRLNNRVPNLESITANLPGTAPVSGGNWE